MMRTGRSVTDELMRRGELWEPAPGMTALRGDVARLRLAVEAELQDVWHDRAGEEWHLPPAVSFATLDRADYFAAFPQWLSAVAHLDGDDDVLADIADAEDAPAAAVAALRPAPFALQPAVCYHVYAALAGRILSEPHSCTASGTCWRHEAGRFAPLERGWTFTMREMVRIGDAASIAALRAMGMEAAIELASRLGLRPRIASATDPFFAPSTRGRALLQRIRSLKHELMLPLGDGRSMAAASFNDHAEFFGSAFDIGLSDGTPAASGCAAFGIERWVLAVLVEHGTDARNWPLDVTTAVRTPGSPMHGMACRSADPRPA